MFTHVTAILTNDGYWNSNECHCIFATCESSVFMLEIINCVNVWVIGVVIVNCTTVIVYRTSAVG